VSVNVPAALPSLFVTMGTDHHPFDRLVAWVDGWLADGGHAKVRCLIQTSTSRPARHAVQRDYLTYPDMQAALKSAAAVVCHGGPGTIMECRALGLVPIVVPRLRRLGEVVDDHQVAFAHRMALIGDVHVAETEPDLRDLLDQVVVAPARFRSGNADGQAAHTVERFGELVDALVAPAARARRPRDRRRFPVP
jgi:UDP-N-acetylglucosamine transferase subunit ALG13